MKREPIPAYLRLKVLERDKFTCQYCGKHAHEGPLEIDHIIPVAKGGTNHIDNLITSCKECNRGKRDRILKTLPYEERIKRLEMKVAELANVLGVHEITVRRWELGERSPDAEMLQKVSQVLKVPVSELLGEQQISVSPLEVKTHQENTELFVKNSAYEDKKEIQNSVPSMAYWGSLVDNAEKTAENGKNLDLIIGLVNTALDILKSATSNKAITV